MPRDAAVLFRDRVLGFKEVILIHWQGKRNNSLAFAEQFVVRGPGHRMQRTALARTQRTEAANLEAAMTHPNLNQE